MRTEMRSLIGMRKMPVPEIPYVKEYGRAEVGIVHEIKLFPAIVREKEIVETDGILENGQASCFFHAHLPASGVCEISGRMICDLCKTEWEGKTVSFESLQEILGKKGKVRKEQSRTKWDDIALALALFPLLVFFITIVTAPVTLIICLWFWRKGPTSIVRKSRIRYVVAGSIASLQIIAWIWLFILGGF